MEIIKSLNELIFPSRCISCGELGISICSDCRRGWNPHIYTSHVGTSQSNRLQVVSSVLYSPIAQKVILGAKESHLRKCDELVAEAIAHSLHYLLKSAIPDYLVPIPSRPRAVRERGRRFIDEMALFSSQKYSIPIATPLQHQRMVRDQSGLDLKARRNNVEGAMVVRGGHGLRGSVVLIDDLVTTGATLSEAARALRYAGITVIGAVTAALASPLR